MAKKGKSIKFQWVCKETGVSQGIYTINKDKLKELPERKMYSPSLKKKTAHKAKITKS